MNMRLFAWLRSLVPAAVRRPVRRLRGRGIYTGDYASWAAARAASGGYEDAVIFEKTLAAARAVRDGDAAWERDTVLFTAPSCNAPLLEALRRAAAAEGGRLNLVDFGGALGSTWWQQRAWLGDLHGLRWSVVEQPRWVEAGRREFTIDPLRFYASLQECWAAERPSVILLSSVLPYLERPHDLLAEVRQLGFRHVIIDRTGFTLRGRDRLTVQRVPPAIYAGSYPCWFLDRAALLRPFAPPWRIVAEWRTADEADIDAEHRGMYLEKQP
jgi:putative methyltransferase (TIGR04325 family)